MIVAVVAVSICEHLRRASYVLDTLLSASYSHWFFTKNTEFKGLIFIVATKFS